VTEEEGRIAGAAARRTMEVEGAAGGASLAKAAEMR
jgi:hypothetical protein